MNIKLRKILDRSNLTLFTDFGLLKPNVKWGKTLNHGSLSGASTVHDKKKGPKALPQYLSNTLTAMAVIPTSKSTE
jgi:hypothetical protein